MIIKPKGWLAYKLTGVSAECRSSDYFTVLRETDKAYQVAYLRDTEPLGWVAKWQTVDEQEDDTEEWNKMLAKLEKKSEENKKWLADYAERHAKEVEELNKRRVEWFESKQERIEELQNLEDRFGNDSWVALTMDYGRDQLYCSCGFSTVYDALKYIQEVDLGTYRLNFNSIHLTLKTHNQGYYDL